MTAPIPRPSPHHRHDGDGWVECSFGGEPHRHWGRFGAAGLFLARRSPDGRVADVVLQHRALWSHHGGTWGIPGGALASGEDVVAGALRESAEEAGIVPAAVRIIGQHTVDHGLWRYTTVVAEPAGSARIEPRATDAESLEVRWVSRRSVSRLPLLPAFAVALPSLLALCDRPEVSSI